MKATFEILFAVFFSVGFYVFIDWLFHSESKAYAFVSIICTASFLLITLEIARSIANKIWND